MTPDIESDWPDLPLTPYRVLVRKIAAETDLPVIDCAYLAQDCVAALRRSGHLPAANYKPPPPPPNTPRPLKRRQP